MSLYTNIIAEVVPNRTSEFYDQVEDIMRHDIFHSTLDWQTKGQLQKASRQAAAMLDGATKH